jgi:hypothetical protein
MDAYEQIGSGHLLMVDIFVFFGKCSNKSRIYMCVSLLFINTLVIFMIFYIA